MKDPAAPKPTSRHHDEPLFESMVRIATLRLVPPLSPEQVARHVADDATRGFMRSYRKFAAGCLVLTGVEYVSAAGKAWPLAYALLGFAAVFAAAIFAWRGARAALAAGFLFVLIGLLRSASTIVSQFVDGQLELDQALILFGMFGFFLHVFAAALQIEQAKRHPNAIAP